MTNSQQLWLEKNAVTCRIFRGRWSLRHCLRIYGDIKDLKIRMATRANGRVVHHQSCYNPCEHCTHLKTYLENCPDAAGEISHTNRHYYKKACAS